MTSKAQRVSLALGLVFGFACTSKPQKFDGTQSSAEGNVAETSGIVIDSNAVIPLPPDNRSNEQLLCEDGPKITGAAKKADFTEQFNLICQGSAYSSAFKEAVAQAYSGAGTPTVTLLTATTDANFVTKLALIFAIKAPLENPSLFVDLKPHDIFAPGIKEGRSELFVKVESRQAFPGKGSLEQIILNYDLKIANGASLYDVRRMEFNSYLLKESKRDITIASEYLLDADKNEYYHKAQGLTVGLKNEDGQSTFVFVTDLVIKNRIDPDRLKVTLSELNGGVARMMQQYLLGKAAL